MTNPTASPASEATTPQPPIAEKHAKVSIVNGDRREDDYYWLRDKTDPKVLAYLNAENSYADAVMKPTDGFQQSLYKEMLARIKQTDLSPPYRRGTYHYYVRTEEGKQYPVFCRRKADPTAGEEVTLDLNQLAVGHKFMALGDYEVSPDEGLLAYTTDSTGFRQYVLHVKDLRTGQTLTDAVERVTSVAWATDNRTLFYSIEDETSKRSYRLYRHALGGAHDLLYEEKDEKFELDVSSTRSHEWIVLSVGSHTASEQRVLRADQPTGTWRTIAPRVANREYYLDHHGDRFWIRVNDTGRNFRLVSAPVSDPSPQHWKEEIAHDDHVMLTGMAFFKDFYALFERENGLPQIRIADFRTGHSLRITMPEPAYTIGPSNNAEYDTDRFRYSYQSFLTPLSIYDYVLENGQSELIKRTEVLGGYDASKYTIERIVATAKDGVQVPISLVYRKGVKPDGSAPMLLYGYGSYGIPSNVTFNSNRFSLLDRGVVYAVAHIRGGGEMGKKWHDDGRMMKKMNTFTDFIACAEHLIAQKFTSKDRLVIQGGSAGGLLMGACANLRPDLFKGVLAQVPFVDVINTMLDESLPLTVGEFEEWGNPRVPAEYAYMKQYCPYTNIAHQDYPDLLIKTSLNDSQVMYWEPAKFTAKLRSMKTGTNPLLFKCNMGAGHGGASGRYDALHDLAFDYAWVLGEVGINGETPLP